MRFFDYPYVIITILAFCLLAMGAVGLYFTIKSLRTVRGITEKGFCGIAKIENDFEKAVAHRNVCSVVYATMLLDGVKRLYGESVTLRLCERVQKIVLHHFCEDIAGEIALYEKSDLVVLCELSPEETMRRIERCYKEIHEILVEYRAINVVRVVFGYHTTGSVDVTFKTALSRAKQACSMAEENGELFCRWDAGDGKRFEQKIKMENSIQDEIENNRFFLEYQPIMDATTDKIVGAEVLSRLNSVTDGVLKPHAFLSAVNNVGLNDTFDYYIFEKNCKWVSNDKEHRSPFLFTINFSRSTFCEEDFADNIIRIVENYGCDYRGIALEILEDKDLTEQEIDVISTNLKCLKEKGIRVLLDDFGKGYTTFGDMADFDIDIVKIDKSITQNATTEAGFVILKNIIRTAHDLGIKTLCEGVETAEHKALAIKAGCDLLQGYYFYRPMSVVKFEALVNE